MINIYAAGPWFSEEQERVQGKIENFLLSKKNVSVYRPRHDGIKLKAGEFHDPELRKKVFADNILNIDKADLVVANLDGREGFLDTGTVWEVGYAMAHGIPVIGYQDGIGGKINELFGSVSKGFYCICNNLSELNEILDTIILNNVRVLYDPYIKGNKIVLASPDNNEEHVSNGLEIANILFECYSNDVRWVDKLNSIDLSGKVDEIFKDVEYFVAVIDDRHPVVSWLMGQAYARNIPTISYTNYDFGVNIMLLCSIATHIKGVSEFKDIVQSIKRGGIESLDKFDSSDIKAY